MPPRIGGTSIPSIRFKRCPSRSAGQFVHWEITQKVFDRVPASDSNARTQIETADALAVVNESTRALAGKDASAADSKLVQFLKTHPSPPSDNQKELWRYIATARAVCERQRKEAETHVQRAQLLLTANEIDPAIEEYNQANRLFPSQTTTEKIRQLSAQSSATSSPQ